MARILNAFFLLLSLYHASAHSLRTRDEKQRIKDIAERVVSQKDDLLAAVYNQNAEHGIETTATEGQHQRMLQDGGGAGGFCIAVAQGLTNVASFGFWDGFTNLCPVRLLGNTDTCDQDEVNERVSLICETIFAGADRIRGLLTQQEYVCESMCTTFYTVTCQGCP
mmetsp:Transcript_27316/g.41958  ORF Transcript_27316/g.41958 Transcript_27316/m.41958 type:complete len:166 (-) Transcript_27316:195-692(-)|eukprot:CAMPEP_0118686426 /NCGR_PEP_ID=MMETSP0800-20121206/7808_1 /TAXON_ID=210618 ORGANISM="Striatella unipunctata, Strain CCMP2910" /NCGR_SAMPLE_ID=MMETSP0800 /ASSEMBLY_ACC=CAM_ASM_000638 /LENGTH=165 /DNA_ID=CAMNT_0006583473 /DNA_START=78 /DNA_END=575 /DNA_ORIENTATION=-